MPSTAVSLPQAAPIEEVPGHQLPTVVLTNALYYNKPKVLSFPLKISFIAIVRVKNNDKKNIELALP